MKRTSAILAVVVALYGCHLVISDPSIQTFPPLTTTPLPDTPAPPVCGINEVPATGCGNLCTDPHCTNVTRGCPRNCELNRCTCKPGYLRNKYSKCVRPCKCEKEPVCPRNQTLTYCHETFCPKTCRPVIRPGLGPGPACVQTCSKKLFCDCNDGYLKNDDGICVLKEDCPKFDPIPFKTDE